MKGTPMQYTTKMWFRDAAERAVKTFAQAVIASVVVIDGVTNLHTFGHLEVWSIGGAAALLSVLSSVASRKVGFEGDASAAF